MRKRVRSRHRGTANRSDGELEFDYSLPLDIWTGDGSSFDLLEATADLESPPVLPNGTLYLPVNIKNPTGFGARNDDSDGFAYDVLFWQIEDDGTGNPLGFSQPIYIFREPEPDGSTPQIVTLSNGGATQIATILIEDYNSAPVEQGTGNVDRMIGTEGSDGMYAFAGNDELHGLEGDDSLCGGDGDDLIFGGDGDDLLAGNAGNDRLYGEADNDSLNGLEGDDTLYGGSGGDTLYGWAGDDILYGGDGRDFLAGDEGSDTLYGGTGSDTYLIEIDTTDTIVEFANQGIDTVQTYLDYTLGDNLENLVLLGSDPIVATGNALNNSISIDFGTTDPVNHTIFAGGGNDTVFTGTGNNYVDGGDGDDVISESTSFSAQNNDTFLGGAGNDRIDSGDGDDSLNGGDGNDSLNGGNGIDTLIGGSGNDVLEGWFGNDTVTGGLGADTFVLTYTSNPFFTAGVHTITDFNWQQGDKVRVYANQLGIAIGDYSDFSYNATTGGLLFDGTQIAIIQTQSTTNFVINRDIVISGNLPDDPLPPSVPEDVLSIPVGLSLTGTAGADELIGDGGDDGGNGGVGNDRLVGLEGNDNLNGADGNDFINAGSGNDSANGGVGKDALYGEAGNDILLGEANDDFLDGGSGDDQLDGGANNDTLHGGTGNDGLTGGAGNDRFNFYHSSLGGIDTIADFNPSEDQMGIYVGLYNLQVPVDEFGITLYTTVSSQFKDAGLTANTTLTADQFQIGTGAVDSSDRFIYDPTSGALFFDVDGTGAAAQIQIATLSVGLALSASNILAFNDLNITAPPELDDRVIRGTPGRDRLIGTARNNTILGFASNDLLSGEGGNDVLKGAAGNDNLRGGSGRDILISGVGNDKMTGAAIAIYSL
ncbi:MAG: calcium-binding protein [Leptolyngbyaceae cyanobacterium SL_7_1]|nr:calcium-binding protein [Leptolyngbyaceae cyanobacterium SL_7_1]